MAKGPSALKVGRYPKRLFQAYQKAIVAAQKNFKGRKTY